MVIALILNNVENNSLSVVSVLWRKSQILSQVCPTFDQRTICSLLGSENIFKKLIKHSNYSILCSAQKLATASCRRQECRCCFYTQPDDSIKTKL